VNIERSAKMNAEVGGHLMAGHIATTAEIVELSIKETGAFIKFRMPPDGASTCSRAVSSGSMAAA
jgi:riboflavin synthase